MSKVYSVKKIIDDDFKSLKAILKPGVNLGTRNILRTVCVEVANEKIGRKIARKITRTMSERYPNAAGLAAPQCGVNARVFVIKVFKGGSYKTVINPKIVVYGEEKASVEEGCLSIPNVAGRVIRSYTIEVMYSDGKEIISETLEGIAAICFQHEYDHLEGVLYTDKAIELSDTRIKTP